MRQTILVISLAAGLVLAGTARAGGGNYAFDGGSSAQRAAVRAALNASAFDWGLVPARITIHIAPGMASYARRGEIWIDPDLLSAGSFAWAFIQHEYAHQIDFFLFDGALRARLLQVLGGRDWCWDVAGLAHRDYGCERFASTLAWAYWPSPDNALRPSARTDESAAMPPAQFRALLKSLIGAPDFSPGRALAIQLGR